MSSEIAACIELRNQVPRDWDVPALAAVTEFQEGPGILAKDFREFGIPLLRLRNIESPLVQLAGCNYLDPDLVAKRWQHFRLAEGDLLISTSASLGRVSVVGPTAVGAIPYTGIIRFNSSSSRLHHNYLRAFLSSAAFVKQAERMATGSVIRHFGPSHLRQMAIALPPLNEQLGIAEILDVLDGRIALIQETNATLEAIAQTLFKSWFIDFDPVRANQQDLAPFVMDEATAALFPGTFEESELGPIPQGWSVRALDDVATYLNGLALQKFPPSDDSWLPVIKIAQLRRGNVAGADRAGRNLRPEYIVRNGDVLFSWSGSLEVEVWCGGDGALNQHLFKVTSEKFPKWFYLHWTRHHLNHFRQIAASKATTMGHIQRVHLSQAKVAVPPVSLLELMDTYFGPLLERTIQNKLQAQALADLRDTLLPRLVSGQLRMSEAEVAPAA